MSIELLSKFLSRLHSASVLVWGELGGLYAKIKLSCSPDVEILKAQNWLNSLSSYLSIGKTRSSFFEYTSRPVYSKSKWVKFDHDDAKAGKIVLKCF